LKKNLKKEKQKETFKDGRVIKKIKKNEDITAMEKIKTDLLVTIARPDTMGVQETIIMKNPTTGKEKTKKKIDLLVIIARPGDQVQDQVLQHKKEKEKVTNQIANQKNINGLKLWYSKSLFNGRFK